MEDYNQYVREKTSEVERAIAAYNREANEVQMWINAEIHSLRNREALVQRSVDAYNHYIPVVNEAEANRINAWNYCLHNSGSGEAIALESNKHLDFTKERLAQLKI